MESLNAFAIILIPLDRLLSNKTLRNLCASNTSRVVVLVYFRFHVYVYGKSTSMKCIYLLWVATQPALNVRVQSQEEYFST